MILYIQYIVYQIFYSESFLSVGQINFVSWCVQLRGWDIVRIFVSTQTLSSTNWNEMQTLKNIEKITSEPILANMRNAG